MNKQPYDYNILINIFIYSCLRHGLLIRGRSRQDGGIYSCGLTIGIFDDEISIFFFDFFNRSLHSMYSPSLYLLESLTSSTEMRSRDVPAPVACP